MIEIRTGKIKDSVVYVPGSKSFTHRSLIAAALSEGSCRIDNPLKSEDTLLTLACLKQMGIAAEEEKNAFVVHGCGGRLKPARRPIDLGNSGTSMRLLTAVAALGQGRYLLTGTRRMQQRPIADLLDGLRQLGVDARSINGDGCPPVEIAAGGLVGGPISIDCHVSSQYLSALLLIAPFARQAVDIGVVAGPVSKPYVDMTLGVMRRFGVSVVREGYRRFSVEPGQRYRADHCAVEADASGAGYFWAAAAVTGARITVAATDAESLQGDMRFVQCLKAMGCRVEHGPEGIGVVGGPLRAIRVDMSDMPDMVPTLAVVAAFAEGTTVIENVAHLKAKESDRLQAVVNELRKMNIDAHCDASGMQVRGGEPRGAVVKTYDDHRIAMSFAVAGLRVPGVNIKDESCVKKSFPTFWDVLNSLFSP
jgi:3-phosphoshikimate 1-carboxyvinyltransferase